MFLLKWLKNTFLDPVPSIFDLCVAGLLFIPRLGDEWNKGTFLISYSAFLVALGLMMKPKREYRNIPLSLIAIWSLINVFIHSFEVSARQITFAIVNYELMMEGFLYIFLAALFIITVVRHATNLKFIYIIIPFAIIPWFLGLVHQGSTTPVAALGIAIIVYLFVSKRRVIGLLCSITGIVGAVLNWKWICMKWACRPLIWHQLAKNVVYREVRYIDGQVIDPGMQLSPFLEEFIKGKPLLIQVKPWLASIFGGGFENTINNKYMWVDKDLFGWSYMQNDFLHFGQCLGPVALILLAWFIIDCFRKIGCSVYAIPFLTVVLICFFQLTMWQPGKAGIYLLIGTVSLFEGLKRRRV